MSRKLGVLVHGAGWVSTQHIEAYKNNPHTRVVAISSRRLESARKRAEEAGLHDVKLYDDYHKALENPDVDIVSICTPQHLHAKNTIDAAKAGKHMLIEKPIANSVEEMKAMRDAVRKAKVKTVVSFVLRWNPLFEAIKILISSGFLGKIYYVETDYQSAIAAWWSGYEDARKKETGVSAFLVGGCHAIDAMRWFASEERYGAAKPIEVFAYSGGLRKGKIRQWNYYKQRWEDMPPLEYDDLEVALVKFDNGVIGKVSVNFGGVQPYTFPIEIFGDHGTIKDNRLWSAKFEGNQKGWITIPTILPDSAEVTHHPFQQEIDHFVDCILNDRESHCNLEDAIRTHEVAFAALKCYETGRPVRLPLLE
ncbi:MAG: Gfo/Idh/MocA family oxidoreductase [Nitrososphaerota archaeon]